MTLGPFKCPECGVWWAGVEHRCQTIPAQGGANAPVIHPEPGPHSPSLAPWCGICGTYHIPGHGACTATYSGTKL